MFGETESKYLAGLLDADGSLSLVDNNGYLHLVLCLSMSESIDREGRYAKYLESKVGTLNTRKRDENWAIQNEWKVRKRNELEHLLPHVIKHMVVKGNDWQFKLLAFREYKGKRLQEGELELLREQASSLRGPVKHKNHPTWAWAAGYIDGDGWYLKRKRKGKNHHEMHVGVVSHQDHTTGLELLHKAFGGVLKDDRGCKRWIKNLGPRDRAFAISFLRKMVRHSKLKKWKIEQLLSTYSQRLSVNDPTG